MRVKNVTNATSRTCILGLCSDRVEVVRCVCLSLPGLCSSLDASHLPRSITCLVGDLI